MADDHLLAGTRGYTERFHEVATRIPDSVAVGDLEGRIDYRTLADLGGVTALRIREADLPDGPLLTTGDDVITFAVATVAAAAAGRASIVVGRHVGGDALVALAERSGAVGLIGGGAPLGSGTGLALVTPAAPTDLAPAATRPDPVGSPLGRALAVREGWSEIVTLSGTSGSTGDPKLIAQRALVIWGRRLPPLSALTLEQHLASNLPLSPAMRHRITLAIMAGGRFTAFPLDRYPPRELLQRLAEIAITDLTITPSVLRRLHLAARGRAALDGISSVSSIGEPLRWPDVARARELCGPNVTVLNRYGSTEAGLVTRRTIGSDEPIGDGPVDVGHPYPGRHVWIAREDGLPAAVDEVGRIVIEGPFTTVGAPLEELAGGTARFRTEDVGRLDATGALWIEGRADRMVKVAATRVELGAVEDVIRAIDGVRDAAVLPIAAGEGEWRLVAHVVVDSQALLDAATLRRITAEHIVPIAVPARFHLRSEPLPLLASGKVDSRALLATDAPDGAAGGVS